MADAAQPAPAMPVLAHQRAAPHEVPRLTLSGVIPATFTPFRADGSLHLAMIAPLVEKLVADGVGGLFILGTTGEGNLMTVAERKAAAEAFIRAAGGRLPVLVHVGHASLHAARDLAAHAAAAGADALAALPPYYHKPESIEAAVRALEFLAAAGGELPLLYYHIPQMSGVPIDPAALLEAAAERVPTLAGIKFSHHDVTQLAACGAAAGGRFQALWGVDEALLAGLTAGAAGGIGSSYNYAAPLYAPVLRYAAGAAGATLAAAQAAQERSRRMQSLINGSGGIAAAKALMPALGVDCGPTRLPLLYPDPASRAALHSALERLGFYHWLGR
jgi:N-acetylneuraminate lyase